MKTTACTARWAKAAAAGDRDAFGKLYDTYIKEIYRFVYYKTHQRETAEDITADIFVKALHKVETFDTTKGTFRTWLYTIARSTVIDFYRVKKYDTAITDAWDIPDESDTTKKIHARVDMAAIRPYMAQLSADQRDILMLRLWEEKSYKEIATILGKSEASCKMAFSRSIKTLREQMPLHLFLLLLTTTFL